MLQYHHLIVRSKTSLGSSREVAQGCGVSFINCLYLVPLIIGQNFCATSNQTGPRVHAEVNLPYGLTTPSTGLQSPRYMVGTMHGNRTRRPLLDIGHRRRPLEDSD